MLDWQAIGFISSTLDRSYPQDPGRRIDRLGYCACLRAESASKAYPPCQTTPLVASIRENLLLRPCKDDDAQTHDEGIDP